MATTLNDRVEDNLSEDDLINFVKLSHIHNVCTLMSALDAELFQDEIGQLMKKAVEINRGTA